MTLQYRINFRHEDVLWRRRIQLCNALILNTVNDWCQSDADFPTTQLVACCLHLFSKRCYVGNLSTIQIHHHLTTVAQDAIAEYHAEWPHRSDEDAVLLIDSLSQIFIRAARLWDDDGLAALGTEVVATQLADEIVAQQYVIFHRYQTTKRDQ